jgi:CRP-like cAMP-binding protein
MQAAHQTIANIFQSKVPLSDAAIEALCVAWKQTGTIKRHDYLIQKDQVETNLFFIIEGTLRIYYPYQDEEICVGFAYPGNVICSYPSFIKQKPSAYYIQALSSLSYVAIKQRDFYALFDEHPKIERAWRLLQEDALMGKIERETEMLTYTAEERYARLLERSPHIFQHIPRKYIASYLRMSPETLSRLRPSS